MASNEGDVWPEAPSRRRSRRRPNRVWAVVSDIGTHGSWSPKKYTVEWVTGQPNQVGSKFHSVGWGLAEQIENTSEITERVEPTTFAFRSTDPQGGLPERVRAAPGRRRGDRGGVHTHVPEDARDGGAHDADRVPLDGQAERRQAVGDAEGHRRGPELTRYPGWHEGP